MHCPNHPRQAQRGISLIEALIGFVIVSLGTVSVARLQRDLRLGADTTRQRSEAVRLAQQDLEQLRVPGALSPVGTHAQAASGASASYRLERRIAAGAAAAFKTATVQLSWTDTGGTPHASSLASVIDDADPALAGALSVPAPGAPQARVAGRATAVPMTAKDLGNGRSVWKPTASATLAYVFDNASGRLVSTCQGISADTPTRRLTSADLQRCSATSATLLSGVVRISPTALVEGGLPALTMALDLTAAVRGEPPPLCATEAQKVVVMATPNGTRREAVAVDATPAALGLTDWTELGERFVAYHCAVAANAGGWSGRSRIVPQGWTIGSAAGDRKICRYASDRDGSGAVDRNAEHPADYVAVEGPLMQQNFLIVRGDESCPGAAAIKLDGLGAQIYADLTTVQHQP